MMFEKSKILRSSRGWSTHGAAHRANVQLAKVNQFYFAFAYISFFYPSLLFTCYALLCLTFILLLFLVCFYVDWNVFLTNIRHVFLVLRGTVSVRWFF